MCYSALVWSAYHQYVHVYGADIDIKEFARLYGFRRERKLKTPKAMDDAFTCPSNEDERQIKALIDDYNREQTANLEQELFKQAKRLADAERALQTKTTKAALESQRIATAPSH